MLFFSGHLVMIPTAVALGFIAGNVHICLTQLNTETTGHVCLCAVCHVPVIVHRSAAIKRTWCSCYVPSVYTCFHVYFLSFFSALYCVTWENMPLFLVDYSVDKDSPLRPVSNFLWMNSVLSTPFSALTLSVWWLTPLSLFTLYFCSVDMWYCISYVPNNKADVWRH